MSKKYNEIMDQVRVTDEMKQRVLQNVKEGIEQNDIEHVAWSGVLELDVQGVVQQKNDCAAAAASGKWTSAGSHGHGSRDGTGRDHGRL